MSGNGWRLTVRVGDDVRHLVEAMAAESGLTPPQLVRVLVRAAAHRFRSGYEPQTVLCPAPSGGPGASNGGPGASNGVTVKPASIGVNRRQSASTGSPGASIGVTATLADPDPSLLPDGLEEEEPSSPPRKSKGAKWPVEDDVAIELQEILADPDRIALLTRPQVDVARKAVEGRRLTAPQHELVSDARIQGMPDPVKPASKAASGGEAFERSEREREARRRERDRARAEGAVGAIPESEPADMGLSISELLAKRKREKRGEPA